MASPGPKILSFIARSSKSKQVINNTTFLMGRDNYESDIFSGGGLDAIFHVVLPSFFDEVPSYFCEGQTREMAS